MASLSSVTFPHETSSHYTPDDLSLGSADVSEESVKLAVDFLFQMTAEHYRETLENSSIKYSKKPKRFDKNPDLCHSKTIEAFSKQLPNFFISFPHSLVEENRAGASKYFSQFTYHLKDLNTDNPMESLLDSLSRKIASFGFSCCKADVRLEKGFIRSATPYWHYDGIMEKIAITICYSNRENWSTRIINPVKARDIFKSCDTECSSWIWKYLSSVKSEFVRMISNETTVQKIESSSEPTKFGYFYNARELPHRSPLLKDLKDAPKKDDFRLFIRFH